MAQAVRFYRPGGPEVLHLDEVHSGDPGPGQVLVHHAAIGVSFSDVYARSGRVAAALPGRLGEEAAGVVAQVGAGVTRVKAGDRVAYATGVPGAYATERVVPADTLIHLPPQISFDTAAGAMRRGLTAAMLLRRAWPVLREGDTVLVHAAAGGVGLIVVQWAKLLRLNVIGTVSSISKARLARAYGADHVILYQHEDVAARVRELTSGRGAQAVFDGVGRDSFEGSLASLATRGALLLFGSASGDVDPVRPEILAARSLVLTCPVLADYLRDPVQRDELCAELFSHIAAGRIRIEINQRYWLSEAPRAHRDLEARTTTGSSIFVT